jgi:hypothetical protein
MGCTPDLSMGLTMEEVQEWDRSILRNEIAKLKIRLNEICGCNPDPRNFQIITHITIGRLTMVSVAYPNCTNFQGSKILIYLDTPIETLQTAKMLDPHFAENPKDIPAPIIRLIPTPAGWRMGLKICELLDKIG